MSVDIFGRPSGGNGSRGPSGPPGPQGPKGDPGKGGFEQICKWLPDVVLQGFRENQEACCFLLTNPEKDVKRNGKEVKEWISRSSKKNNAIAIEPSKEINYYPDIKRYALEFDHTLYEVDDITISSDKNRSYTCLCVTFRISGGDEEQFIVSNYDDDNPDVNIRGISVTSTEIRIWGAKNGELSYIPIQHIPREWTTVYVEWSNFDNNQGTYIINNTESVLFTCNDLICEEDLLIFGGLLKRGGHRHYLTGEISALEIYTVEQNSDENGLPLSLIKLIIKNQLIKNDSSYKRKREE
tara:strand:- start:20 stop:907 length:888 start_codon:yes stop_codon:yes gene_type:complete